MVAIPDLSQGKRLHTGYGTGKRGRFKAWSFQVNVIVMQISVAGEIVTHRGTENDTGKR
jgi:hypothetical protein